MEQPILPSWEVLDEEAKARGMSISYEVDPKGTSHIRMALCKGAILIIQ
jgi:hypothetical protein